MINLQHARTYHETGNTDEDRLEKEHHAIPVQPGDITFRLVASAICHRVAYYAEDAVRRDDDGIHHLRHTAHVFSVSIRRGLGR